ncbi:transglutaminase family protein [Asticcacaulis solisilvae]|uniref:transglutaminase family protein n=1 Tax=Asticcacaulis solisilvae TaxID=1217274 RepID=UPI003FD7C2BE
MSIPELTLCHRTVYQYNSPVRLEAHRLVIRPREAPTLQLGRINLAITPEADVTWAQDVFGNHIATARFDGETDYLCIEATSALILSSPQWPVFAIDPDATGFPFPLREDLRADLGLLARPQYPDPSGRVGQWVRSFIASRPMDTLTLLQTINSGLFADMTYEERTEEGHRAPLETLILRSGACRDLAVLFVEGVRSLGFGARLVSGYLYDPAGCATGTTSKGATHAWAEVFLPGAGWIAFDPTNGRMGGHNLIPVGVGRCIDQLVPVSGSYLGAQRALRDMAVTVTIG